MQVSQKHTAPAHIAAFIEHARRLADVNHRVLRKRLGPEGVKAWGFDCLDVACRELRYDGEAVPRVYLLCKSREDFMHTDVLDIHLGKLFMHEATKALAPAFIKACVERLEPYAMFQVLEMWFVAVTLDKAATTTQDEDDLVAREAARSCTGTPRGHPQRKEGIMYMTETREQLWAGHVEIGRYPDGNGYPGERTDYTPNPKVRPSLIRPWIYQGPVGPPL